MVDSPARHDTEEKQPAASKTLAISGPSVVPDARPVLAPDMGTTCQFHRECCHADGRWVYVSSPSVPPHPSRVWLTVTDFSLPERFDRISIATAHSPMTRIRRTLVPSYRIYHSGHCSTRARELCFSSPINLLIDASLDLRRVHQSQGSSSLMWSTMLGQTVL